MAGGWYMFRPACSLFLTPKKSEPKNVIILSAPFFSYIDILVFSAPSFSMMCNE